jgi:cobalt-precorrin-5B (C1)-methyltransferase
LLRSAYGTQHIRPLRRGWTTGAFAAGAARAAFTTVPSGCFPNPVSIRLPRGPTARFPLGLAEWGEGRVRAGVVKDAGGDPDVTLGALIVADIEWGAQGSGIGFAAGEGVGTVTRASLPLLVGEPAINPAPRAMISDALLEAPKQRHRPTSPLRLRSRAANDSPRKP